MQQALWLWVFVALLVTGSNGGLRMQVNDTNGLVVAFKAEGDLEIDLTEGQYIMTASDMLSPKGNFILHGNNSEIVCSGLLSTFMTIQDAYMTITALNIKNCPTAFLMSTNSTLDLQTSTIKQSSIAGIKTMSGYTSVQVDSCTFVNPVANWNIYADENGYVTVTNTTFSGGQYGIFGNVDIVSAFISQSTFSNHTFGIYLINNIANISQCNFTNNTVGIVIQSRTSMECYNATFSQNTYAIQVNSSSSLLAVNPMIWDSVYGIDCESAAVCQVTGGTIQRSSISALHAVNGGIVSLLDVTMSDNVGGALWVSSTLNTQVKNCAFVNNSATTNGGAVFIYNSTGIFNGTTFDNNTSLLDGAGIFANQANLHISGCVFQRNLAHQGGGGLFSLSGNISIESSEFHNNTGYALGGGVQIQKASVLVSISNTTFTNNSAEAGGGIFAAMLSLTLNNCLFRNNTAAATGGGMQLGSVFLVSSSSIFDGNLGVNGGGACVSSSDMITFINTTFTNNNATLGGGLQVSASHVTMNTSTITQNHAVVGGGIGTDTLANTIISIASTTCTQNSASDSGGCISVSGSQNLTFTDSTISFNTAAHGGGIEANAVGNISLLRTSIQQNSVSNTGGGILVSSSTAVVQGCNITLNGANAGGGIWVVNSTMSIPRSIVENNKAYLGGGIGIVAGDITISNCTISNNNATMGGGVYALSANTELDTCEVISNYAATEGGGIYVDQQDDGYLFVMYGGWLMNNTASSNGGLYVFSQPRSATYLRTVTVLTTTQTLNTNFCCGTESLANPNTRICNFPACNGQLCGYGRGCECPFTYDNSSTPILPSITNIECLCPDGFYGTICNGNICTFSSISKCSPNAVCTIANLTTANCTCDSGYTGNGSVCTGVCLCGPHGTCEPTNGGNYNCSCEPGFEEMNGVCEDFDECATPEKYCDLTISYCINSIGGYTCSPCPFGYTGTFFNQCTDIDECAAGGCDYHTSCKNTIGSYACGPCPTGYSGTGYTSCTLLCGNGTCDSSIGENCVSCPQDCKIAPCGQCGDGVCQDQERCDECEDCGACSTPSCPKCVNGLCNNANGLCACNDGWTGPSCDVTIQPIEVNTNKTQPTVDLQPSTKNDVSFSISLRTITEYTSAHALVTGFDLQSANFTFNRTLLPGSNVQYEYSTVLPNHAKILITFIQFIASGTYTFNNATTNYPANTIKLNVKIANWPFTQLTNFLNVVLENNAHSGGQENACVVQRNTSASLSWVQVTLNGVAVYAQFDTSAVVDGRTRAISFLLQSDNSVVAAFPHFWDFAELDPLYSVLLSPESGDGCSSKSTRNISRIVIIACVVPIIGIALLVAIALYAYKTYRRRKAYSDLHVRMSSY